MIECAQRDAGKYVVMNAVEVEEAVSELATQPFNAAEFPYLFLAAFGNKETTIKRLRSGNTNPSDVSNGVLQRGNIHIATCDVGKVEETLNALRASPKTASSKARFILATDGEMLSAEDLIGGDLLSCEWTDFPNRFGMLLPLAGISTVPALKENTFDVRATRHLNKLYVELLKDNPEWASGERRPDMNHFMARLIFCFFAEDTDIFRSEGLFTNTVAQMSTGGADNTHTIIENIFRAMNTPTTHQGKPDDRYRREANIPPHADVFPYVNGGLFSGSTEVPRFSKIARSYLINIGTLDWQRINPDIFGSMIQAVADDDERGALGMHYTSVPNILKVLNPLFLDDLREQLAEAGDNPRKLLNLRSRMAKIRVFDPACGSGNFLVIAYKEMREIEAEINKRRDEKERRTDIPITNFRGIELRDFPAEIARLALIIAEYQCDVLYRGQKEALAEFLPLDAQNWITCDNALRIDWLSVCPPTGTAVKLRGDDLFGTPLDQAEIDFVNEGGETYICGNPPYLGSSLQSDDQKSDLRSIFEDYADNWKILDYVAGWFMKAALYGTRTNTVTAFVTTNSICQGQHVPTLWPLIFANKQRIKFAHTSFKWTNLASHNAGVTVVIVGMTNNVSASKDIYAVSDDGVLVKKSVSNINAYLVPTEDIYIKAATRPINGLPPMDYGSKPADGGGLIIRSSEYRDISDPSVKRFIKPYLGSDEYIDGKLRYCLWIENDDLTHATQHSFIRDRIDVVKRFRSGSTKAKTKEQANIAHAFAEIRHGKSSKSEFPLIIPIHTSESRSALPVGALERGAVVSNAAFSLYDAPIWNMALIASRLHLVWIATVCGKLETRYRYSNTLGWNTFPIPLLTEQNKSDLTRCAEDILLAREAHFPATIADLYDPENMPENLRRAHNANDEVLERIYIGRRFKNDTERLEKLFELYTKMSQNAGKPTKNKKEAA